MKFCTKSGTKCLKSPLGCQQQSSSWMHRHQINIFVNNSMQSAVRTRDTQSYSGGIWYSITAVWNSIRPTNPDVNCANLDPYHSSDSDFLNIDLFVWAQLSYPLLSPDSVTCLS
ncbi:hypothetical protein LINPERHAP1_LOCUS22063 [Linum perenne]